MAWAVWFQDGEGATHPTNGELHGGLNAAMMAAQDLAHAVRNTTFFVVGRTNGRIPAVYHFVKV